MMRLLVNVALALGITLSAASMVAAQIVPGTQPNRRDPLLKREFSRLSFGQPAPAPAPVRILPETRYRALETLGAPLPSVTAAPVPHGTTVPCMMRTVPVDPSHKSNMPVVPADEKLDPKFVVKAPPCEPRK
jgi:hypothetical protein